MGFTSRSQLSRRQAQPTASHMAGDDLERPSYQSTSYQIGLPLWCLFAKKAQLDKDMGSNNLEHQKKTLLPKLWDYFKSLIYLYHIELGGNKKLMSCVLVRAECSVWTNHNVEMMQWLECSLWVQILDSLLPGCGTWSKLQTYPCFSSLICVMGIIIMPTSEWYVKALTFVWHMVGIYML